MLHQRLLRNLQADSQLDGNIIINSISNTSDFLQVALDITNDGRLPVPPYEDGQDFETGFFNITIFLSSYDTKLNLTITNGTASAGNASLGDILFQEPKSSVKHVNWIWPECLVGNGGPEGKRGNYNVSTTIFSALTSCQNNKATSGSFSLVIMTLTFLDYYPTEL